MLPKDEYNGDKVYANRDLYSFLLQLNVSQVSFGKRVGNIIREYLVP